MKIVTATFQFSSIFSLLLSFLALLLSPMKSEASLITLNFDTVNSSSVEDSFPGVDQLGGWISPWKTYAYKAGDTVSGSVISGTEIKSGYGNYLSVTTSLAGVSGTALGEVYRRYDNSYTTSNYTVSFLFQGANTLATGQSYRFFEGTAADMTGTGSSQTWGFLANSSGQWQAFTGVSSNVATITGITYASNVTYLITINVNPVAHTWTVTLNNGSTSVTSTTYGFRDTTNAASYLYFESAATDVLTSSTLTFYVDNISIAAIPEPSTYALLFAGSAMLLMLSLRKSSNKFIPGTLKY